MKDLETSSGEESLKAGLCFGKTLKCGDVVAFFGDLSAGKTTFIKGVVSGAIDLPQDQITSPTFTYLHIYQGDISIYHFDLYRLRSESDFIDLGFTEYFKAGGVCLIEWAEKIESLLPKHTIRVSLEHRGEDRRKIAINL